MTAEIYQLRDYQSKKDLSRMEADLNRQAVEIANMAFPSVFGFGGETGILDATQANAFHKPESEPA